MLIDTVRQTIRSHDLIHKGDHIVLGLSGGPDSVCLFHVLQRLAEDLSLTIHPIHVNHQFRPGDAERDQAYVEKLCAAAGACVRPCRSFVVDVNAMAAELGMTSEEAGRKARYDAFVQVAGEAAGAAGTKIDPAQTSGADAPRVLIAVAQNANDQAETILHRILRGTGTDGLSGIAYKRFERGIPVIRPLLDVPRSEIEDYCAANGLDPVIDHTNNEPIYTRNKIRLEILPLLEQYNPNIVAGLTRLGRIAAADKDCLWQEAEAAYERLLVMAPAEGAAGEEDGPAAAGTSTAAGAGPAPIVLDREALAALPEAIRHRVIAKAFGDAGLTSDISEERLQSADAIILKKQAPKTVEFPRGHRLTVKKGRVIFL
ncbi:MAG: tRNA lysidine(34) synthetase TilS [Firmicutes bacterium]|nr:tRNA lysidine(34) synthetase TilS [Bacillota bacterium]